MANIFYEDFAGVLAIAGTAPEVNLASGLLWAVTTGGTTGQSAQLKNASGFLEYTPAGGVDTDVGFADLGDFATTRGHPIRCAWTFDFQVLSSATTACTFFLQLKRTGGGSTFMYVRQIAGVWQVDCGGVVVTLPGVTLLPGATYPVNVVSTDGLQSITALGVTATSNIAFAAGAAANGVTGLGIGVSPKVRMRMGPLMTAGFAFQVAPSPTLAATFASYARLTAPSPTLGFTASIDPGKASLTCPMAKLAGFGGANAYLSVLPPTLFAAGSDSTGRNSLRAGPPPPTLSAFFGGHAALRAPSSALSISATFTAMGDASLSCPLPTLWANGRVSSSASAVLRAPLPTLIGYSGAVCSITVGRATLQATGTGGGLGKAAVTCPLFELTASGTARSVGRADLLAPAARMGATAQAYLLAPGAQLVAIGTAVVVATYEAYSVNLSHTPRPRGAPEPVDEATRYTSFPFTQIVRYQNSYFGVAADGLYLLEGTTDDGAPIAYAVKTGVDDFGAPEKKTAVSVYMSGRVGPDMVVTLHAGETGQESYPYSTPRGQGAQNHREKFGRGVKNRYFALSLAGTSTLELDNIELDINKLTRRI